MNEHYPFTLMPLPYDYSALEPYIDEKTMRLHHDKHLGKYLDNLNESLKNYPEYHDWSLEKILFNIFSFPSEIRTKVKNNAGGVFNHNLFFSILGKRKGENVPHGKFKEAVIQEYKSVENFVRELKKAALDVFGSGYAYVVLDGTSKIKIITTKNQDTALDMNLYPLFLIDVWEHAYYLKYNNKRDEYVNNILNVLNFEEIEKRYNQFFNY